MAVDSAVGISEQLTKGQRAPDLLYSMRQETKSHRIRRKSIASMNILGENPPRLTT